MTNRESANLDFLRSLAVTYVVGFHLVVFFKRTNLGLLEPIGQWGVLLFFVHASFVLMLSLERQQTRIPGSNSFWPFYLRRAFRIFPLSGSIVMAAFIFGWPIGHLKMGTFQPVRLTEAGLLSNLLLIQNVTHADSITAPLWTLPSEMEMYLIFPFLFLMLRGTRSLWPAVGVWLTSVVLAYTSVRWFHGQFNNLIVMVPCFMAGIVMFGIRTWARPRLPFAVLPGLIAAATVGYLYRPDPSSSWFLCFAIGLLLPWFVEMKNGMLRKSCQVVARYSYGIYLVHFGCIWFAFVCLNALPVAARWIVFTAMVVSIPVALYHLIESPLIGYGQQLVQQIAAMKNLPESTGQITAA